MAAKNNSGKAFARFSTVGIQMGIVIGLFAWGGTVMDEKYPNKYSLYTIVGCLLGVFIGMYLMIKEVQNMNRENED